MKNSFAMIGILIAAAIIFIVFYLGYFKKSFTPSHGYSGRENSITILDNTKSQINNINQQIKKRNSGF